MAFTYNKCIFLGTIVTDLEVKQVSDASSVLRFTLAVDRKLLGKGSTGKMSDFFYCAAWNQKAESISRYFKKGSHILVEGEMHQKRYDNKDGAKSMVTELYLTDFAFVSKKGEDESIASNSELFMPSEYEEGGSSSSKFTEISAESDLPF